MTKKIDNVKPRKQLKTWTCGPGSLRTIFHFYNVDISEEQLIKKGKITNDGTSHYQMRKLARSFNFKCYTKSNASVKDLEYWLKKGVPVIVNYQLGTPNGENGHYAVLYGYDENWFFIADPSNYYEGDGKKFAANTKMKRDKFMSVWFDEEENKDESKKWFAIIRPKK